MSRRKVSVHQFNAVFQEEAEGGYSVWVPSLPGCCSQGDTFEEALNNIKEAMELYLEEAPQELTIDSQDISRQFLIPIRIAYA